MVIGAKERPHRLTVRTRASQARNRGSIPREVITLRKADKLLYLRAIYETAAIPTLVGGRGGVASTWYFWTRSIHKILSNL